MKYQISVITPYHNESMDVFQKTAESMFCQTIGFSQVEWIVVLHNASAERKEEVFRLLGGYENVVLDILDNDIHTPSAPRNRGLELAGSDYIGFLDADDQFTPQCLNTALFHMKRSNAQITWFRREFELETEDAVPITEIVLWDQTREEIIVDRDHWDDEKMFSGICGMVTSRIYKKSFLDENQIRFDEEVPFGEDYLFNLQAYGHAEKICYLPQMIGYHYYINHSSLVQSSQKDGKTLLAYARGYDKIFSTGLGYGFYMNAIILGLCSVLARFMISNDELSMEDRINIRNILKPYLEMMTPLKVSKLYSAKAVRERYECPREVILYPENFQDSTSASDILMAADIRMEWSLSEYQRLLRQILYTNHDTDIGNRYDFQDILTISGYQSKVPLTDYDFYEPIIRLQTNVGESKILTADAIKSYMITIGSMGILRLLPASERQLLPLKQVFKDHVIGKRNFLMLESRPKENRNNDNTYNNTAYGTIISDIFADSRIPMKAKKRICTAPIELLFPDKAENRVYARLLFALSDSSIEQIIAPNTWIVWESFHYLKDHWENLCQDIENGVISNRGELSRELRKSLQERFKPDPARAEELREIFAAGFDQPVVPKIWTKLSAIIAFGGEAFTIYTRNLASYIGDIPLFSSMMTESQSILGLESTNGVYRLCFDNTFTEFLPVTQGQTEELPRAAAQVEADREYELVITTYSGLYRYRTGRVVRVVRVEDSVPYFACSYRKEETLKLLGGALTEEVIREGVFLLADTLGLPVKDYAYKGSDDETGLVLYLEVEGKVSSELRKEAGQMFNEYLKKHVPWYEKSVEEGKSTAPEILLSELQTHLLYRDLQQTKLSCEADILMPVRALNSPGKEMFFDRLVM